MTSPANFAATNPEVLRQALDSNGETLARGIRNLIGDVEKGRISQTDESVFEVGRNLAVTPGAVVFENDIIQLIQYAPATPRVRATPLVIVPPCINKFYILDLPPENSFVRYAVERGNTVFMVSWRNITPEVGHLTWDDYLRDGVIQALTVGAGHRGERKSERTRLLRRRHDARRRARGARARAASTWSRVRRSSPRCSTSPTWATSASSSTRRACRPRRRRSAGAA